MKSDTVASSTLKILRLEKYLKNVNFMLTENSKPTMIRFDLQFFACLLAHEKHSYEM